MFWKTFTKFRFPKHLSCFISICCAIVCIVAHFLVFLVQSKAAPMAVQNSEYFGMWKRTPQSFSMAGYTSLHCGMRVRLPMSTKSLMPDSRDERMVAEPMAWSTIQMSPLAMSSRLALALALLKSDATAFIGSPGSGLALMSPMRRLILDTSPSLARLVICFTSSVLSMMRLRPASVPPPMPMPPMCLMLSPSHFTSDVPVPMLTTIMRSSLLSQRAPSPSATNSSLLEVGSPQMRSSMQAAPTPVSITCSTSSRAILLSCRYLPKAPQSDVMGSVALMRMGLITMPFWSMPTILVVDMPTSIPITIFFIVFLFQSLIDECGCKDTKNN